MRSPPAIRSDPAMFDAIYDSLCVGRHHVTRRRFLRRVSAGAAAAGLLSFRDALALQASQLRKQGRAMILLWMGGGPSQFETFDPKPNHENGGETKAISTAVPGIQIAHDWEQTAQVMHELALVRSMTNKEGNHPRATYQMHTGYLPTGGVKHPSFGSCVAQQLADPAGELPSVVSIGRTEGAGFLGVGLEPFVVENPGLIPQNVQGRQTDARLRRRLTLLDSLEDEFSRRGAEQPVENQRQLYAKASKLVFSPDTKAFDLSDEPAGVRDSYGETRFGRGCLLARRLVETGVTFVEVRTSGNSWDTHNDNFARVSEQAAEVDPACAALISDLKNRGLLDRTVVLWTGEFGRTPKVNARGGRDHFPRAFNCWLAGGGIKGGQVIGATSDDGTAIVERPVSIADLLQSLCHALKIDGSHENVSPQGRPLKVVDGGQVVRELFG